MQYSLSKRYEYENLKYQEVLVQTLQNQEMMSELALMTRSYINVNLGLESDFNRFSNQSRVTAIKSKALSFIEDIRINAQNLHDFFKTESFAM